MTRKQQTIKEEFSLSGVGVHTGCQVHLTCQPAGENEGINFIRIDLPNKPVIKANLSNVCIDSKITRCTSLRSGDAIVHTVEHIMSVLCGLGIDNLNILLDAEEVPVLDGSGIDFFKAFQNVGIIEQNVEFQFYKIMEPIGVEHNGCAIYVFPSDQLKVSYSLDYKHPFLGSQFFNSIVDETVYEKEIVSCRTFCLEEEADELRKHGLGKGANYKNTLVVGEKGVKENQVRFPDEFARHKVLDLIGDLYLLGMPIRGHIFATKSGHDLNRRLLKKIYQQKKKYDKREERSNYDFNGKEMDIQGIMKVLPHRYPFLLVDRVIEIEKGKKAIGIKNVTMNDDFFRGHFPTRPVMPGVLMVEAMAQTAGVIILTNEKHRGKVSFFMAVNNVKFRKVVSPGDQLIMEVEIVKDKSRVSQAKAKAKVGQDVVAEADMTFSFTDASYLD